MERTLSRARANARTHTYTHIYNHHIAYSFTILIHPLTRSPVLSPRTHSKRPHPAQAQRGASTLCASKYKTVTDPQNPEEDMCHDHCHVRDTWKCDPQYPYESRFHVIECKCGEAQEIGDRKAELKIMKHVFSLLLPLPSFQSIRLNEIFVWKTFRSQSLLPAKES